jgi:hypothetical protein
MFIVHDLFLLSILLLLIIFSFYVIFIIVYGIISYVMFINLFIMCVIYLNVNAENEFQM